jgi:hypothetical protein
VSRGGSILSGLGRQEASALLLSGLARLRGGDIPGAGDRVAEALLLARELGLFNLLWVGLEAMAAVLGRRAQGETAARLLGAARTVRERHGFAADRSSVRTEVLVWLADAIGLPAAEAAERAGMELAPDAAVTLAGYAFANADR